ncbi:MAG: hypothetical protein Q8L51_01655 [Candidatus Amesbacteria bacterium]|nr:hypothetical protein [Candidatus Amesbacteria bacterium]
MKRPEITIPTLFGIMITLGGLVTGLWLMRNTTSFNTSASIDETPTNIQITNISDTAFSVSWVTAKATSGFVKYGDLVVSDDRDQDRGSIGSYFTHLVSIRGLKASTNYKIKIGSGKSLGSESVVTTGMTLRNPPPADVVYGQIMTSGGDPAEGSLVYVRLPGVVPQVALVKTSGSWVVPLSISRTSDLTSFASYDKQSATADISVQAGPLGTSSQSVVLSNARPLAQITLGQTLAPTPIPESTPISKFSDDSLDASVSATPSKIKLNTIKPNVSGEAPAGSEINIEINSENQIKATVKTNKKGQYNFKIPDGLEPGEHTITVSTLVDGVIQKVTRTFTVEAAGTTTLPVFSATPSAKLKPTPTPIARVALPVTNDQPKSGNFEFSLLLLSLGAILITSGVFGFKNYE